VVASSSGIDGRLAFEAVWRVPAFDEARLSTPLSDDAALAEPMLFWSELSPTQGITKQIQFYIIVSNFLFKKRPAPYWITF
jgi:hypothetical protein